MAMTAKDASTPAAARSNAGDDASSSPRSGDGGSRADAAVPKSEWEGLVTLDASITIAPDGAVISRDGGFLHWDPATAGPVLNAPAQMACLTLASNICNRSADCQSSQAQLTAARRNQLFASCQDTLLRNHNCNRATATSSGFNACAEAVKVRNCNTVSTDDFATACIDQITFQP